MPDFACARTVAPQSPRSWAAWQLPGCPPVKPARAVHQEILAAKRPPVPPGQRGGPPKSRRGGRSLWSPQQAGVLLVPQAGNRERARDVPARDRREQATVVRYAPARSETSGVFLVEVLRSRGRKCPEPVR